MSLDYTTTIVAAYVSNNPVRMEELEKLIQSVHKTLTKLSVDVDVDKPEPAVPLDQSVFKDRLVCLEDGQSTVLLSRYLKRHYAMTPEEYKEKWGLPENYPMVAETYSKERSKIAKAQGLGKRS
jgi:predicted transcriptional regulator